VPTYSYRCPGCGPFELVRPMARSGADGRCPGCGHPGRRTFAAPALRALSAGMRTAGESSERSADSPQVVSTIPPTGRARGRATRYTTDPRHARLPRP
jgi:putative FmdB family regulatory protein